MSRFWFAVLTVSLFACSSSDAPGGGANAGKTHGGDGSGSTGSGSDDGNGPGGSSDDGTSGSGDVNGGIYCQDDPSVCVCSHDSQSGTLDAPCGTSTVGGPAICCVDPSWPSSTSSSCNCGTIACTSDGLGDCTCGFSDATSNAMSSCPQPNDGVCCLDSGAFGSQLCTCTDESKGCPPTAVEVSSCSTSSVGCQSGSTSVDSCR